MAEAAERREDAAETEDVRITGFDQGPSYTLVLEGPELRLVAANRAATALLGPRAFGAPLREALGDLAGQQVFEVYDECYRTGTPQHYAEWRVQFEGPDGEPNEIYVDFTINPWFGPDGEIRGVVGGSQDVTGKVLARMAAEAARDASATDLVEARTFVRTMQEVHLPRALPVLPRLDVAARYLLAADDAASGGDWFEALVRPDGRVALVVGDVVGHGTTASATMGQLRAVCHERLTSTAPLVDALHDIDRFARSIPAARQATLCVAVVDLATGSGEYCTAGHPPPLIVTDGTATFLEPTGAGPLATSGVFPLAPLALDAAGALLVLYTDGLLERPGTTPSTSTVELARVVTDAVHGRGLVRRVGGRVPERVCEHTLEVMTRMTGHADDITMLAARRVRPPTPLALTLAAEPSAVPAARDRLVAWLTALELDPVDRIALDHAVSELVTNAVEHAYADAATRGPRPVEVGVHLQDDGRIRVRVADRGRWREPRDASGRGLQLVRSFLDDLELETTEPGTTVTGHLRASRPARMMTGAGSTTPRSATGEAPFGFTEEAGTLTVTGPVLALGTAELDHRLRRLTAPGRAVTVDLGEVTHLGSAAVRVLHELVTTDGADVTLVAANGSVAQHVLDLVDLPYRTAVSDAD